MRIAIDAVSILGDRSGVGTYTRNLLRGLAAVDAENHYCLYYGYVRLRVLPDPPGPNFRNIVNRLPGRLSRFLVEQCGVAIERIIGNVDVLHEPFIFAPPTLKARSVITVFDVIPLRFPEAFADVLQNGWAWRVRRAVQRADCVITVSEASREDLEQHLHVPRARIRVIPLAADPVFRSLDRDAARAEMGRRYGLHGRIILHLGRLDRHKNVERLIEAFHQTLPRLDAQDRLVLTGSPEGPRFGRIAEQVRALKLEERVRFLGYIPPEQLVQLVNAAVAVVIPSLWEGFGLPVLEAMACGTPVITSSRGATLEIAGGAAVLIDPEDATRLSEAIVEVVSRPELANELRRRGLERARGFSWLRTAQETVRVYCDLAGQGGLRAPRPGRIWC
jgi:glycosyltransferase involved in cell wall biosynthesis